MAKSVLVAQISGFPPLFRRRYVFAVRCMRSRASVSHGMSFSSGEKKSAFNLGFVQFALESKSPFMASHEVRVYVSPP